MSDRLDLAGGRVEILLADLDAAGWPGAEGLPEDERERAARFATAELSRRWVAARWALRGALGATLGTAPAAVAIELAPGGKPRLAGGGPRFNLSHSGAVALVALSASAEVGVDVELLDPRRDVLGLARRALPARDASAVVAAPEGHRAAVFHAAWARREALAKCSGTGIWATDPDAEARGAVAVAVAELAGPPGYAAAVAIAAERVPPQRWRRLAPTAAASRG